MKNRFAAFAGTVRHIVRPAFWIVCAAGQWGPEYATWDDGRVWDVLIRFVLSMAFACMAVQSLRSTIKLAFPRRAIANGG